MDRGILQTAILKYGEQAQKIKAIEELSELTTEIARDLNKQYVTKASSMTNLVDEIADVYIMLEQLKIIYDIEFACNHRIWYKMNRLDVRLRQMEMFAKERALKNDS